MSAAIAAPDSRSRSTPFIEGMLVLLIIFMVAAPLATVDVPVDLPVSTAERQSKPDTPLYLPHGRPLVRHEGITYIRFTMSRDGRVLSARVERSAGIASLDQEGLDLLQRAQPLPPLPADQPGESLELVVPIQFLMRR